MLTNDSDLHGGAPSENNTPLTLVGIHTNPANGSLVFTGSNGSFVYTPNSLDFVGTDSFVYRVQDSLGGESLGTVYITVTEVNDPPVVVDDNITTNEDAAITFNILANDSAGPPSESGQTVTVFSHTNTANGTLSVNVNGTVTYTPNPNFYGTDSFQYTARDNGTPQLASIGLVFITVNPVNDKPSFTIGTDIGLAEDAPAHTVPGFLNLASINVGPSNETDNVPHGPFTSPHNNQSNSNVTITVVAANPAMFSVQPTINPTTGTLTFTAAPDANGSTSVSVFVQDTGGTSNGGEDTGVRTFNISLSAVSDVENDSTTGAEDVPQTGNLASNDNFEGPTSYSLQTAPIHGSVVINTDGTFTYTPVADYNGSDSFSYKVSNNGADEFAAVSVTVNAVADVVNDTATVTEDVPYSGSVAANDNFEGPTTYALDTAPTNGLVTVNPDGTFTYTPNADFNGTDSFTYKVTNNGAIETATVSITIDPVADVVNDSVSVTEDIPQSGSVATNDNFEGPTTYALDTAPTNGLVTVNPDGTFTYTPNADFNGTDSFTYKVTNNGAIETATVSVTVSAVADVVADTLAVIEDTPQSGNVATNDNFEGPTTYALDTAPTNGLVTVNPDGTFTYTPNADFNGTDSFTYKVTNSGAIETATVSVTVSAVADVVADTLAVVEDTPQSGNVAINDNFEGPTTYALDTAPTNGLVTVNPDGTFTYTPNADFNGTDSFTYKVTNNGAIETATVSVTVSAVADVVADTLAVIEDTPQNGNVATNDNFEGPTTYALDTAPTNGLVTVNPDGTFTYTPNADFNGTDSFTYKVTNNVLSKRRPLA